MTQCKIFLRGFCFAVFCFSACSKLGTGRRNGSWNTVQTLGHVFLSSKLPCQCSKTVFIKNTTSIVSQSLNTRQPFRMYPPFIMGIGRKRLNSSFKDHSFIVGFTELLNLIRYFHVFHEQYHLLYQFWENFISHLFKTIPRLILILSLHYQIRITYLDYEDYYRQMKDDCTIQKNQMHYYLKCTQVSDYLNHYEISYNSMKKIKKVFLVNFFIYHVR